MDKFLMFFINTLEDEKKNLVKFDSACDIYNVAEDNVACRLFILTLKGSAHEDFIQYTHVENVATGLQWPHLDDGKSQEHWQQ
jgi:hypothetical protein